MTAELDVPSRPILLIEREPALLIRRALAGKGAEVGSLDPLPANRQHGLPSLAGDSRCAGLCSRSEFVGAILASL